MILTLCILLILAQSLPSPARTSDVDAILAKAIEASGGADALKRARVLNWRGKATIYGAGGQIHIEGQWTVEPPDRATVTTWEIDKGESSTRRMILEGTSGTMERGGKSMPMPPDLLANERDQFYLYSVLKLTPLLDPDVKLTAITEDGLLGVRAVRPGRPEVSVFFDRSGRPTRLLTSVLDPATKQRVAEEFQFQGMVESEGVRWPRRIRILQNGKPFYEMEISEFTVAK